MSSNPLKQSQRNIGQNLSRDETIAAVLITAHMILPNNPHRLHQLIEVMIRENWQIHGGWALQATPAQVNGYLMHLQKKFNQEKLGIKELERLSEGNCQEYFIVEL